MKILPEIFKKALNHLEGGGITHETIRHSGEHQRLRNPILDAFAGSLARMTTGGGIRRAFRFPVLVLRSSLSLFRQSGIFKVKSLSQNIPVRKIEEYTRYTDSDEEKKQTLIDIGKSDIHSSFTLLANSNPNLAQPINSVNPIANVANDPIVIAGFAGSKNFKINDASINLDRSSQKSDNFFSSYSDRNGFSSFAIQRYTINSISLLST